MLKMKYRNCKSLLPININALMTSPITIPIVAYFKLILSILLALGYNNLPDMVQGFDSDGQFILLIALLQQGKAT